MCIFVKNDSELFLKSILHQNVFCSELQVSKDVPEAREEFRGKKAESRSVTAVSGTFGLETLKLKRRPCAEVF